MAANTTSDTVASLITEFDPKTSGGASRFALQLRAMDYDDVCQELGFQFAIDNRLSKGRPSWMQRLARAVADEMQGVCGG